MLAKIATRHLPLSVERAHLRSANNEQYDVPRVSSLAGSRAFSLVGPRAWNQLPKVPISLRRIDGVETFKRNVKAIKALQEMRYPNVT